MTIHELKELARRGELSLEITERPIGRRIRHTWRGDEIVSTVVESYRRFWRSAKTPTGTYRITKKDFGVLDRIINPPVIVPFNPVDKLLVSSAAGAKM